MRYEDTPNARIEFTCGQVETLAGLNVVRQANKILLTENMPPPAWRRFGKYLLEGLAMSSPTTYRHPSTGQVDGLEEPS